MKCPNCKQTLKIPMVAYLNLETYNVGRSVLVASDCCGTGFKVKMNISYDIEEYIGNEQEDDWGNQITKTKNQKP